MMGVGGVNKWTVTMSETAPIHSRLVPQAAVRAGSASGIYQCNVGIVVVVVETIGFVESSTMAVAATTTAQPNQDDKTAMHNHLMLVYFLEPITKKYHL
jgi:hypothetical protein